MKQLYTAVDHAQKIQMVLCTTEIWDGKYDYQETPTMQYYTYMQEATAMQ